MMVSLFTLHLMENRREREIETIFRPIASFELGRIAAEIKKVSGWEN